MAAEVSQKQEHGKRGQGTVKKPTQRSPKRPILHKNALTRGSIPQGKLREKGKDMGAALCYK